MVLTPDMDRKVNLVYHYSVSFRNGALTLYGSKLTDFYWIRLLTGFTVMIGV